MCCIAPSNFASCTFCGGLHTLSKCPWKKNSFSAMIQLSEAKTASKVSNNRVDIS